MCWSRGARAAKFIAIGLAVAFYPASSLAKAYGADNRVANGLLNMRSGPSDAYQCMSNAWRLHHFSLARTCHPAGGPVDLAAFSSTLFPLELRS